MSHSHAWSVERCKSKPSALSCALLTVSSRAVLFDMSRNEVLKGLPSASVAVQSPTNVFRPSKLSTIPSLPRMSEKRSRKQNSRDYGRQALRIFQWRSPRAFRIVCRTVIVV